MYLLKTCPSVTLSNVNPTWPDPGLNPGCRKGRQWLTCYSRYCFMVLKWGIWHFEVDVFEDWFTWQQLMSVVGTKYTVFLVQLLIWRMLCFYDFCRHYVLLIFRQPEIRFTCMWVWISCKAWTISLGQNVGMQLCTVCWIRVWRIVWKVSSWVRHASTYIWWVLLLREQNYCKLICPASSHSRSERQLLHVLHQLLLLNSVMLKYYTSSTLPSLSLHIVECAYSIISFAVIW
jgi:hypothetical protein